MHVGEKLETESSPSEALHPTQGASPRLKLVSQPPLQLLLALSSLAIFPNTESGAADGVRAADDVRRDATVFAACRGRCGLATCFGASTVMRGSVPAEPAAVCDIAVPLGPHSNAVDKMATADGTINLDDNLMTRPSPQIETEMSFRLSARYHKFRIEPSSVKKYLTYRGICRGCTKAAGVGARRHRRRSKSYGYAPGSKTRCDGPHALGGQVVCREEGFER